MGSLQTGFWSSGIPRDYNQIFQQYVLSSHCVPHTRAAHPSLHHSVPQEGDLYTLDQPGHLGSALAGDLRPGGEVSLGIYPLAPTLLVCISTKAYNPSFLQMPGLLPPQQLWPELVTAPRPPGVTIHCWFPFTLPMTPQLSLLRVTAVWELTNTGINRCFSELRIPGYRFLHHTKCSQDEVFTYI